MANSTVISESRVELHEGDDVPKLTYEFDENNQYGAYGVLGVREKFWESEFFRQLLCGATVVTLLPYNETNRLWIQGLLNTQMGLAIPDSHREWVEWIDHKPNPLDSKIGTIGWKYSKR